MTTSPEILETCHLSNLNIMLIFNFLWSRKKLYREYLKKYEQFLIIKHTIISNQIIWITEAKNTVLIH